MPNMLCNRLRRRIYYVWDSLPTVVNAGDNFPRKLNSVANFTPEALEEFVDAHLKEIYRLREARKRGEGTRRSIRSQIRRELNLAYHNLNALRYKDQTRHDTLAEQVDRYHQILFER